MPEKMTKQKTSDEINKLISICHSNLKNSNQCLKYLKEKRKVSDRFINKYKLGYFPQNLRVLTQYVSEEILQQLVIMDYNHQSKFADYYYLIFPIFSEYGDAVGIGGRTLLNENERSLMNLPKYENSRYKKSNVLFGLDKSSKSILNKDNVYVVEGHFDVIAMDTAGITNTVAICGTAFSKNHFLKLARYTDKITIILDRDDGGIKSMESIYTKFSNKGLKLHFKLLPEGFKDLDEYFASGKNKESFEKDLELYVPM